MVPRGTDDGGSAAAAAHGFRDRLQLPVRKELDSRRRADLGRRREALAEPRVQLVSVLEMKAGSAIDVEVFRCDARGASIASGSDMPKSSRSSRICSTVVMIVEPPGLPTPSNGRPSWSTIVGAMLERGRLPPTGRFGSSGGPRRVEVGELVVAKEAVARQGDPAARELHD